MASAVPPERKVPMRSQPKLEPVKEFIDEILRADQQAPRKQRHTAHRIWQRIGAERSEVTVAESTVRHYVCRRKQELGMAERETFVPQSYDWGSEAQVDWYEAFAEVMGELRKVYCFAMRSMAGGGAFHRAYYHATQQAFLEAHEFAVQFFGGVFRRLRYDNLKSAVKKILRGYQREETERLIALRSHWGFQTEFCNPARGNEKGGVEGEVGYFRRNHLVPVPRVESLEELNNLLHRTLQVVVAQPPKHPAEELKRELVCFQKRLLGGVIVGAMKRSASRHRAHREAIHLAQLAHDFRESFVPINLCLAAPVVALRHERLPFCHPQVLLATADVMTHGRFRHRDLGPFRANPLPDAVRRMPLLARSLLLSSKNLVDELFHRFELGLRPDRNLALPRDPARDRLPHDPPMHPELLRHPSDRSYPKAVLPPA